MHTKRDELKNDLDFLKKDKIHHVNILTKQYEDKLKKQNDANEEKKNILYERIQVLSFQIIKIRTFKRS